MNDDQLSAELRRRAQASPVPDLLPAVRTAIDARPTPVAASRWSPLVGLAGFVAVVLLLFVALPPISPGPTTSPTAQSNGPANTPDPAPIPSPVESVPASGEPSTDPGSAIRLEPRRVPCDLGAPKPHGGPFYWIDDAAGLVLSCQSVAPSEHPESWTAVSRANGKLEVTWSGSDCQGSVALRLTRQATGIQATVDRRQAVPCEREAPTWTAVEIALMDPIEAGAIEFASEAVEGSAWWELDPAFRPGSATTRLHLVVYERACANGEAPVGRVLPPRVTATEAAVTLTFEVEPLIGGGDCPLAPGAPVVVRLGQPLGDGRLVDGDPLAGDVVIEASNELLALSSSRVDSMAFERLAAVLGDKQCMETSIADRYVPTGEEVEAAVAELEGQEGDIRYGGYVSDGWLSAARAFEAIEAYSGRPKPWYIVRPIGDSYWLSTLIPTQVSGRTVWFLGDTSFTYVDCPHGPTPVPDVGVVAIECPNSNGSGRQSSVWDRSGTVESCVSLAATREEMMAAVSSPNVVNPAGDQSKLRLSVWVSCARSVEITMVRVASDRWEVEALDPGSQLLCGGFVSVELPLAEPIPADQVDFTLVSR